MSFDLFKNFIINSSVIASLLIVLIFIFKLFFGKHVSARWHYVIWFVLLLRLVVPYMSFSPFFISDLLKTSNTVGGFTDGIKQQLMIGSSASLGLSILGSIGQAFDKSISFIFSNSEALFVIWALGVVILSLFYFVYSSLFWKRVKNGTVFTDQNIIKLLEECKQKLGIQTNISIIQTSGISIPAIFGVTRPWLLIPERVLKSMEYENLRYIILHELAHLKRKDILVNWISLILQIIHWFNPFVWLAFNRMRLDREMACDETVLLNLEKNEVKKYGHTILDLVEIISGRVKYAGVAGILEEKSQIRVRISRISGFKGREKKFAVLVSMMLVLLGCSILVNAHDINGGAVLFDNNALINSKSTVDNEETRIEGASDNVKSPDNNIPITTKTSSNAIPEISVKETGNASDKVQNNKTNQQMNAFTRQNTTGTQINSDIQQQDTASLVDDTFDESETDQISTVNTEDTSDDGVIDISPTGN